MKGNLKSGGGTIHKQGVQPFRRGGGAGQGSGSVLKEATHVPPFLRSMWIERDGQCVCPD